MKIVIALDSFKGTMSAAEACATVATEISAQIEDAEIIQIPVADGGEGTIDSLTAACNGEFIDVPGVTGPLPEMRCTGRYGWLQSQETAVIEMANVSGLPLLTVDQRNPLLTTTYGTGQLISHAITHCNARRILLALGGSATVDGGTGAARACGWQFLDDKNNPLPPGGGYLTELTGIIPPENDFADIDIEALCDVTNPLCGASGAAAVYGPQKGATPEMVEQLEVALRHLADCITTQLGSRIADTPGAGAAGGFGAGALAFFDGRLVPGFEAVAETCKLKNALQDADWVITGEGRLDTQSLQGKVVDGVNRLAKMCGTKTAVIAGTVQLSTEQCRAADLDEVIQTAPPGMPNDEAIAHGREHLQKAARSLARPLHEK
ncbi:MAG: glycerate kinase [Lentisphaeria bacterium]